jgi:5'-deoxynucleotidase YfbR-like HD superfamily hydrolase
MNKSQKISEKELLNLIFEVGVLKRTIRTGWQKKKIKDPESVAEHTWRVVVLAMILAPQFKINQDKAMKMALVHDLGEALIGDVIWEKGKKIIGSQTEKHKDEKGAIEKMFADNPHFKDYVLLWEEFEKQETTEAKFVKELDKIEMAIQAYEYEQEGYSKTALQEFWDNAEKYLANGRLNSYFNYLKTLRKNR